MESIRNSDVLGKYEPERIVVLAHGCWDLLHLGHIRHLQEAKKFGNWLVVSVTADKWVNKGMGRPHFTAEQRAEALGALACVDEVVINDDEGAWNLIRKRKPAFYVKGTDYIGVRSEGLDRERDAIAEVGGQIRFTSSRKWSSSQLINMEKFSNEICEYLALMKDIGAKDKIFEAFDRADRLKITFVGEEITDVYHYVRGLGRASKELMLASVLVDTELWAGGVSAAAKHGDWSYTKVVSTPSPIVKTRYVDVDFNKKLFDVYGKTDVGIDEEKRDEFRGLLSHAVAASDIVIVNDFGHGLMGAEERSIAETAHFLALNCQTNAGNYGFNLVTKYKKANYICIDAPEARLAAGMPTEPINDVVWKLSKEIDCREFLITHGRFGSTNVTTREYGMVYPHNPALVQGGIDTMGAGDAVMAVTAPLVAVGLDLRCAALVGNIVGAIKVGIVGHRRHVGRQEIIQTVEALLA